MNWEAKVEKFVRTGDHSDANLKNLLLRNLSAPQLENICKFLYIEYIPGNRLINMAYWLATSAPFLTGNKIMKMFAWVIISSLTKNRCTRSPQAQRSLSLVISNLK